MKKQSYVCMANHIITDPMLYPSAKRVLFAMVACAGRHGTLRKSLSELAALSGCSAATVRQALDQLQERGFLRRVRRYRFDHALSRPVYAKNTYQLRRAKLAGSYTLIPRSLLHLDVTHAAFTAALYLYMKAGRKGRSYASLRTAAEQTYLSKATICRALKALRAAQAAARCFCIMANRAYSCCSYYPTGWIRSRSGGGLIFSEHPVTNKITEVFYLEGKTYGVPEFGKLTSFLEETLSPGLWDRKDADRKVSARDAHKRNA